MLKGTIPMVVLDGYQGDRHTGSRVNSCASGIRRVLIPASAKGKLGYLALFSNFSSEKVEKVKSTNL